MDEGKSSIRPRRVAIPVKIEDTDRKLFTQKRWETFQPAISKLASSGLVTTDKALFIYGMFLEWDARHETKHTDFARALPRFRRQYDEYVQVNNSRISFDRTPRGDMAERLGVAGALSIGAQITGITEADFRPIPISPRSKSLDYELTLTALGPGYKLEIEAKGTHDGKSTAKHSQSIREKKHELPDKQRTIRFGCVTDIAIDPERSTTITLIDPPGEDEPDDPPHERLINRLRFYLRRLRLLTPNGRITVALANRLQDLLHLRVNWSALDGITLVGPDGAELLRDQLPGRRIGLRGTSREMQVRIYPIEEFHSPKVLSYIHGLERTVLQVLIDQHHSGILALQSEFDFFEISDRSIEGYLQILPSGLSGGLAYVDRSLFGQASNDSSRDEDRLR